MIPKESFSIESYRKYRNLSSLITLLRLLYISKSSREMRWDKLVSMIDAIENRKLLHSRKR